MMEFRVGATGAGVLAGCGAGLGLIAPLNLHSVPVLGQLIGSLASSFGSVDSVMGGLGSSARRRVRSLGVRGLDLGFGCGVMLGYGYGAGLFLTPDALHGISSKASQLRERVLQQLPPTLRTSLEQRQQQQAAGTAAAPQHSAATILSPAVSISHALEAPALPGHGQDAAPAAATQQQGQQAQADVAADLMRLVLRQQTLLDDLQQQVATLQAAVCKFDPTAPGCKKSK